MLFKDGVGFCPWHKRDSSFKVVHSLNYASPHFYSHMGSATSREFPNDPVHTGVMILECLHCKKSVIVLETEARLPPDEAGGEEEVQTWRTLVSPSESPRTLHEAAPAGVRSLFAEASICERATAFRAAGVMYRATVEELVKDQNATGRDLYTKIDSLQGQLPVDLIQDLHEARMLGNDSIHAGIIYSADEVEDVARLIEEAVLVLYVQPEEKRAMRAARKARRDSATA
ncbi:DUF4145 domain-containing protein [Ornithinimicrobium cerasi]|uniref:DUF4145 domain-containing protein n=1 Tax=Ornithinimicrobium cerasi TaxID=2248773 RepID=UPI000EFF257F|nr:DUF4145 domain-containing protein [Ornithinimicrobium cerasi]